jgi:hypothetical protein
VVARGQKPYVTRAPLAVETSPVPSELALILADFVLDTACPEEAARDLHRLLGPTLAQPDPAAHRWDLLHALAMIIRETNGATPTVSEYQSARERRFPDAPAPSSLTERYGTWYKTLDAAARLMNLSASTPVWTKEQGLHHRYTLDDCAAALAQFRKRFGDWPRPGEYRDWSRAARRAAQKCGARDPRLPDLNLIYKRFGTFDRAIGAAQSLYGNNVTARDFVRSQPQSVTSSLP